jgi:hypothetical protein
MDEFGCFVCGAGRSKNLDACCEQCSAPFDVASSLLTYEFGGLRSISELGRGFYGTVLLAQNQIGKKFALKLCSSSLYEDRQKDFRGEIQKYLEVGVHPNIAELFDSGEMKIELFGRQVTVFFFVTSYVRKAKSLDSFIAEDNFSVEDMIGISTQVCAAVARVEGKGLWHNDLHGKNILLAPRESDDLDHHPTSEKYTVKVVDFGSAVVKHPRPEKDWEDVHWIAKHLRSMLTNIQRRSADLPKSEKWFLRQLPELIDEATDPDPSRRIRSAHDLAEKLDLLWQKSARHGEWQPVPFVSLMIEQRGRV